MDIAELGENESIQNTYIFDYMSRALQEMASICYVVKESDPLTVNEDGYVTFKRLGSPIDDLYEPLRIVDSNREIPKRTAFMATTGWWRDSANSDFHFKGLNGTYTLHYKAYPTEITSKDQMLEFPPSGYMVLVYYTCGLIRESKNFIDESQVMYARAKERMKIIVKANIDGRGVQGGSVPSVNDVDLYFKG